MAITGPAAGHPLLATSHDRAARELLGTANNCSMGVTPWGTYLACEENANGYFHRNGDETPAEPELFDRYGDSETGFDYLWATTDERFNTSVEPNEPNRFHWVVEVIPNDPGSTPVKRSALGRFKHESAAVTDGADRQVVVHSGDDERGDYIYEFVGNRAWNTSAGAWPHHPLARGGRGQRGHDLRVGHLPHRRCRPYDPDGEQDIPAVGFGSPDGMWFDPDGRSWIQTDSGQPIDSNDQMVAADPTTGELRGFLVGVPDCEVTGIATAPDQKTMFVNIQHPGDAGNSDWPDQVGGLPRPATVIITKDDGGIMGT